MSTRIPVTLDGRLTADPETGHTQEGKPWTRFSVAVNDRRLNEQTGQWEDGAAVFHQVVAFGKQAEHAAASLKKGTNVLVSGDLKFGTYEKDGNTYETRQVIADNVAASVKYHPVQRVDAPKVSGPEAYATGPVAQPGVEPAAQVTR